MKRILFILFLQLVSLTEICFAEPLVSPEVINSITHLYHGQAKERLIAWEKIIQDDSSKSEMDKIKIVNAFFNQLEYRSDAEQLNKLNFWMTPVEFLVYGGGDCKDYAISKYFTLEAMGVEQDKLRMAYVIYLVQNVAHMVLTYYPTPDAIPLVLDNLTSNILTANKRPDLKPVYSFNGDGLWMAVQRGEGRRVSGSDKINTWRDLNERMVKQLQGSLVA